MSIGHLHVLLLHFPIALALAAALTDLLWAWRRKDFFRHAGFYCLLLAALSAIPTVIAGDQHFDDQHFTPGAEPATAIIHARLGFITLGVVLAAALTRTVRENRPRGAWLALYIALIAGSAAMVTVTAFWGGKLTWPS